MRQYKVFQHPSGTVEAVKQGWSWPGFFFNWIWALFKKMWARGIVVFVVYAVMNTLFEAMLGKELGGLASLCVSLAICIIFGLKGNSWREANLVSRGYALGGTVTAANPDGAVALHLTNVQKQPIERPAV